MSDAPQIIVPGLAEAQQQRPPATGRTAVTIHDGRVVLHFERATEYAVFDAVSAVSEGTKLLALAVEADKNVAQLVVNAAMFLVDHVYDTRGDLKPAGNAIKHELIERHRRTLTQRLVVVMNSQREKKTISNRSLARQLLDIVLSEVFS